MIIDTHVHYNLEPLWNSWKTYIDAARNAEVAKHIIVGTNLETSVRALHIAEKENDVFWSAGIHPIECKEMVDQAVASEVASFDGVSQEFEEDIVQLELLAKNKKCVAIGEIGLDYYHLPQDVQQLDAVLKMQRMIFTKQIELAKELDKPVILHVRDKETLETPTSANAYWDALEILRQYNVKNFTLHCVSGPLSYVKQAVEMGGYMGFDGNITYPNAQHIREIFAIVPEERRLLETDAPFLPPQEFRGKICEPSMIAKTAEYVEKELGGDRNTFTQNAERFFIFT